MVYGSPFSRSAPFAQQGSGVWRLNRSICFADQSHRLRRTELILSIVAPVPGMDQAQRPASTAVNTQPIKIGGNMQAGKLIQQPRPVYPPDAKAARIQGVVKLEAIIAKDGTVKHLEVVSGHPLLVVSALEAVKNWVYQTTLLNGEPVEVQTMIDVNYTLSQ